MRKIRYIFWAIVVASCVVGCVKYDDIDCEIAPDLEGAASQISFVIPTMDGVDVTRAGETPNLEEYTINNGYLFVFSDATTCKGYMTLTATDITGWADNKFTINASSANYNSGDKIVAVFNYDVNSSTVPSSTDDLTVDKINELFPLDADYLADVTDDLNTEVYALGMPMAVNDFEGDSSVDYHEVFRALARLEVYVKKNMTTDASSTSHSHEFNEVNTKYAVVNNVNSGTICPSATKYKSSGTAITDFSTLSYSNEFTPVELTTSDVVVDEFGHSDDTTQDALKNKSILANRVYLYPYNYSTSFFDNTTGVVDEYSSSRFALLLHHTEADGHDHGDQFYKLNLVDKANGNKYYDLERNHDYRVIITKVHSHGYDSASEAYYAPPSNIEYEIYDDQGDATLSNGQYAISMDEVVNYNQIDIFGHNETVVSFNNISYVMPDEMTGKETWTSQTNKVTVSYEYDANQVDGNGNAVPNPIKVSVKNPFGGDSTAGESDFSTNGQLTSTPQDIEFTITGTGTCTIGLEIQLGNLKTGVGEITINKQGSAGEGALDAHPVHLRYDDREYIEGSWRSAIPSNDFGARVANNYDKGIKADSKMVLYMGHNATPIGFNTMDGSYTSGAAEDSYPIFEEKSREGYYTYKDTKTDKIITTKVMATQLDPYYIGHFGRKNNDGSSTHHYKAVIVERIEEIPGGAGYTTPEGIYYNDANATSTRGVLSWGTGAGQYYPDKIYDNVNGMTRYTNFVEGLMVCNKIFEAMGDNAIAVKYCYMKNDINGNGIIEDDEPIEWYLPAQNQMVGFWVSKYQFDKDHNSRGTYYFNEGPEPSYWTSSEIDAWNQASPSNFTNGVLTMNMLEGETIHTKSKKANETAHVRCMRGVDSY